MGLYLQITDVSKTYDMQPVLNRVSLLLHDDERVGLVGANGVGKSTLLRIVNGEVTAEGGQVVVAAGVRIGYLAQAVTETDGATLADLIDAGVGDLRGLEARMRTLETAMSQASGAALEAAMSAYGEAAEQFERRGGYALEHRINAVLTGLGIGHLARDQAVSTLSGGEKARAALAALLLGAPDLLLLDEPTNHLDAASLAWLETTLSAYRGAILMASHDREFLNRTATGIVEIDEHTRMARRYPGNYDAYAAAKAQEREAWAAAYAKQQEEIKALRYQIKEGAHRNSNYRAHTDNDKFVRNIKRATHDNTVSKNVRAAEERLKRLEADPVPEPPEPLRFKAEFDPQALRGRAPLAVTGVRKRYGARVVLDEVSFTLDVGSRVVIVGPNGAGKSTLLRIIGGVEAPDSGEVQVNPAVRLGYLDQEGEQFDPALTAFEAYRDGLEGTDQVWKATLIQTGLFRFDDVDKRVGDLSSGQRRKLQLARLIAVGANLLLLDEPTNHVSLDVVEGLEAALRAFPGPVLAVSHDRRFIRQSGAAVWTLEDGRLVQYAPESYAQTMGI